MKRVISVYVLHRFNEAKSRLKERFILAMTSPMLGASVA